MTTTRILLLGATGRTGTALLRHRPENARLYAGVRVDGGAGARPAPAGADGVRPVELEDPHRMRGALEGIDVVVNAIRLRGDIPRTALVELHDRIVGAWDSSADPLVVHVGGAGALRLGDGRRFWQDPAFPRVTLPRGIAHAALRDHLESGTAQRWAYLIPPPDYRPDEGLSGTYRCYPPSTDERAFLGRAVGYQDFSLALADAVTGRWTGTHLIAG